MRWLSLLLCLPLYANADLLPPDAIDLQRRAERAPGAYDRADLYCRGKEIGQSCQIPGNPFQGGGQGECRQIKNSGARTLDALCILIEPIIIDRQVPESRYRVEPTLCDMAQKSDDWAGALQNEHADCSPRPATADRFCLTKPAGADCQAEVSQGKQSGLYAGHCVQETERTSFYFRGRHSKTRELLLCRAKSPSLPQIEPASPPGILQKWFR